MRLRLKVLRWIVVTALISTGSLYFYVRSAVFQELGAIEAREEAARFDIVRRLLDSSTAAFQAWSYEYAIWDEMSAFLKGKNPGFLAKNFTKDEMNGIDVHAGAHVIVPKHVFVFARNKLVGYVGLDKGGTRITAPAPNWMSLALAVLERRNLRGWQETNTGYANADGRTYQYVLRIATNSGADAEEEGFLLVFREWGVDEVADLKGISGLSLEYVPVQAGAATHDSEHAVVVGDGIQSEKAYTDFLGSPVFSVRLTSPRTSFKMGSQALNLFLLMIFALSFATITAVVLAFDRLVLNRIARLHNTVQSAKDDRGAIEKLEQSNEDEISDLSGEMKRLFSQLVTLAENDFLTGIPNRRSFFEHASLLQKLMGDANGYFGAIVFDLDKFKNINDTHGHPQGDEVIRVMASILRTMRGPQTCIGRFGGEEFVVFAWRSRFEEIAQLAEVVRGKVEETKVPLLTGQGALQVTVSAGVAVQATTQFAGAPVEQLIALADEGLYAAKHGGRNCVRMHQPKPAKAA